LYNRRGQADYVLILRSDMGCASGDGRQR